MDNQTVVANPSQSFVIAKDTKMGATTLNVEDLGLMKSYYHNLVGLEVLKEDATSVSLGAVGQPVIMLKSEPELHYPDRSEAGLYHNAILFPNAKELATVLDRMLTEVPNSFQGSSDHKVSKAFYFVDPEGNGLELYVDRPRSEWQWQGEQIVMGSSYIDPQAFIREAGIDPKSKPSPHMGHVHLQVGNIQQAKAFYVDVLGFSVTAEMDSALFVSAGGYHHHLGMNTWHSLGADQRGETLGLRSFEVILPTAADMTVLVERIKSQGLAIEASEERAEVRDPWGNLIILRS